MRRNIGDIIPPLVAVPLVAFAAVLTLLPIALAIFEAAASVGPDSEIQRVQTTPSPTITPHTLVRPPRGDRKEITT